LITAFRCLDVGEAMGLSFSAFSSKLKPAGFFTDCLLAALLLISGAGCQSAKPEMIASQRALIDFTGLGPLMNMSALKSSGSVPQDWDPLPLQQTPLYAHEQWRSPTMTTGVGVACIHLPIPVPAVAILWFAQREYSSTQSDGRSLGRWTDSIGREWFAAENRRFYVRGYVVTRGMDAWIVYCGYRRANAPRPDELSLAVRSLETIVPGGALAPAQHVAVATSAAP
jgi:hypothetical protein